MRRRLYGVRMEVWRWWLAAVLSLILVGMAGCHTQRMHDQCWGEGRDAERRRLLDLLDEKEARRRLKQDRKLQDFLLGLRTEVKAGTFPKSWKGQWR